MKLTVPALQSIAPLGWASLLLRYRDNLTPKASASARHSLLIASFTWPWSAAVGALTLGWDVSILAPGQQWRNNLAAGCLVQQLSSIPSFFAPAAADLSTWAMQPPRPFLQPGKLIREWSDNFQKHYIDPSLNKEEPQDEEEEEERRRRRRRRRRSWRKSSRRALAQLRRSASKSVKRAVPSPHPRTSSTLRPRSPLYALLSAPSFSLSCLSLDSLASRTRHHPSLMSHLIHLLPSLAAFPRSNLAFLTPLQLPLCSLFYLEKKNENKKQKTQNKTNNKSCTV